MNIQPDSPKSVWKPRTERNYRYRGCGQPFSADASHDVRGESVGGARLPGR